MATFFLRISSESRGFTVATTDTIGGALAVHASVPFDFVGAAVILRYHCGAEWCRIALRGKRTKGDRTDKRIKNR